MKFLKKYNEQAEQTLYMSCLDVFAELLDDRLITITDKSDSVVISLNNKMIPTLRNNEERKNNFNEYIEKLDKWTELFKDIDVGVKRLKDEYGDLDLYLYKDRNSYNVIKILISTEKNYKEVLIKKIVDNVFKYGGDDEELRVRDIGGDAPLYDDRDVIEIFHTRGVTVCSYNDYGDLNEDYERSYEGLSMDALEEIFNIIQTAIDDGDI